LKTYIAALILIILCSSQLFGQEVILIRHAEVYLNHSGWMNSKKAAEYREAYDTAPIHQFNPEKVLAQIPKRITDTIYVSGLPRSIGTGIKLFGSTANIVSLDVLNEFEMHMVWLPLYLPYKGWTGISRSMWLLGTERKGTESYREAKKRVSMAADFIEEKSTTQKQVIMVTHGFFNRNLAKELKKRDWEIIRNEGKENLGSTILKK
jgi:hypothetical protein